MHIVEKQLAPQDRKLARTAVGGGKGIADISWQEVPANLRSSQKLSDDEIMQVAEIGKRIEEHYGFPQDIEWAKEDHEYLTSSRRAPSLL